MSGKFLLTIVINVLFNNSFSMEENHQRQLIKNLRKSFQIESRMQKPFNINGPLFRLNLLKSIINNNTYPYCSKQRIKDQEVLDAKKLVIASYPINKSGAFRLNYTSLLIFLKWAFHSNHNHPNLLLTIIYELPTLESILKSGDIAKSQDDKEFLLAEFSKLIFRAATTYVGLFTELNVSTKEIILETIISKIGNDKDLLQSILEKIVEIKNTVSQSEFNLIGVSPTLAKEIIKESKSFIAQMNRAEDKIYARIEALEEKTDIFELDDENIEFKNILKKLMRKWKI